jgi:hypothetical protein
VTIEQPLHLNTGISIKPGNYQVRALRLLGTADMKGHQEMILYAGGEEILTLASLGPVI